MMNSPLTDAQKRYLRDALQQPRRIAPIPRVITHIHISVRRLSMRERVGRLRRSYPGISRAAAARLLRAQGVVVYETQISHGIPLRTPLGELGGFLIPEELQAGAQRLRKLAEDGYAMRLPARLLKPEGPQNAPAQVVGGGS